MIRLALKLVKTFIIFTLLFYFWVKYLPGKTPMDFLDYVINYILG